MKIAILGAGAVGSALGILWKAAGHEVRYGVRHALGGDRVDPLSAAHWGDVVVIAIPFLAVEEALPPLAGALAGKVVIDATNPLQPDYSPLLLGQENSAGETVQRLLPGARVVKAFNSVFADVMNGDRLAVGASKVAAFIAGDDADAVSTVAELARRIGFDPIASGAMASARWLEAMAHLNIHLAFAQGGGTLGAFGYDRGRAG